jgi:hypothetical protein
MRTGSVIINLCQNKWTSVPMRYASYQQGISKTYVGLQQTEVTVPSFLNTR